jgi:hypothetical protein
MRAVWGRFARRLSVSHAAGVSGMAAVRGASSHGVMANYVGDRFVERKKKALLLALFGFCFFYGMVFGVFGSFMLSQLMAPVGLLALMIIWLLPQTSRASGQQIQKFLFYYTFVFTVWPDYIAIDLPGLPWITAVRLTGFPLIFFFVLSLRMSSDFRKEVWDASSATVWIRRFVLGFTILAMMSIGFSTNIALTMGKISIVFMFYLCIFFISSYVFSKDGNVEKFAKLIWVAVLINCVLAAWEFRFHALPWDGHLPKFLQVEDASIATVMARKVRAFTTAYRVRGRFPEPLSLAEFLVLAAPFVVHRLFTDKSIVTRVVAIVVLVTMMLVVNWTDSRFGRAGLMVTAMCYLFYWAAKRWRFGQRSLWGPALIIGFPAMGAAVLAATFLVNKLHTMVWGGGAQAASSEARHVMWATGWPKIFARPWGHGYGTGASVLGFYDPGGLLTIDSYTLNILLELGFAGLFLFAGMFVSTITYSAKAVSQSEDREVAYLVPVAIACFNFLIIKMVLAQSTNHSLLFIYMGLASGIVYRARQKGFITG